MGSEPTKTTISRLLPTRIEKWTLILSFVSLLWPIVAAVVAYSADLVHCIPEAVFTQCPGAPIGTIVAYAGGDAAFRKETTPTAGAPILAVESKGQVYLLCNGANIEGVSQFEELRTLLGGNAVPDLRGQFLRGLNGNRADAFADADSDRKLLEPQRAATGPHVHPLPLPDDSAASVFGSVTFPSPVISATGGMVVRSGVTSSFDALLVSGIPINNFGTGNKAAPSAGLNETRPNNVSVNYLIRAR